MVINLEENFGTITSLRVAAMVKRRRDHVCRDIDVMVKYLKKDDKIKIEEYFIESKYLDKNNQSRRMYLLTEKGCDLYVTKMTGEKGILFAVKYKEYFEVLNKQQKFTFTLEQARKIIKQSDKDLEVLLNVIWSKNKQLSKLNEENEELRSVIKVLSNKI